MFASARTRSGYSATRPGVSGRSCSAAAKMPRLRRRNDFGSSWTLRTGTNSAASSAVRAKCSWFLMRTELKRPLEGMSFEAVPLVEPHCVAGVQPLHPSRKRRLDGLNDDVEVIRHQAVRVALPAVPLGDDPE